MDTELSPNEPSGSGTAATDTADIKPSSKGSPYKFYFERLTPVEKRVYNAIIEKIYDMPERIAVPKIDGKELDNVFSALLLTTPTFSFSAGSAPSRPACGRPISRSIISSTRPILPI